MSTGRAKRCLVGVLGAVLGGCLVGPNYHRPPAPAAPQYKELSGWTAAAPADGAPKGEWWTDFHDPLLDQLEPMVAMSNQTVRQDYANYQQALAEVKVARAELFPTIGITGSATRAGGPGLTGANAAAASTGSTATRSTGVINSATLEGTASWTLDLWGQVRRLIEENAAIAQSDEAVLANATLSAQTCSPRRSSSCESPMPTSICRSSRSMPIGMHCV